MRFLSAMLLCGGLWGQSLSITAPTSNQSVSAGYITLKSVCSSCPTQAAVEYFVDGDSMGVTYTAPYAMQWSPFWTWNGSHQIFATAYNALGAVVATSPTITFNTATIVPVFTSGGATQNWTSPPPNLSVSCTPSDGTTWSATVTCTVTENYPVSGQAQPSISMWVDGIKAGSATTSSFVATLNLDTTQWPNGTRRVTFTAFQQGKDVSYGLWQRNETFSNGAATMQLVLNNHDVYLGPGDTYQLTCSLLKTDNTTSACGAVTWSADKPVCSVSSTGLVTILGTGSDYSTTSNQCQVTATSGSESRTVHIFVMLNNVIGHFHADGSISNTYVPPGASNSSLYLNSAFYTYNMLQNDANYGYSNQEFVADYLAAGFNAAEVLLGTSFNSANTTQSTFNAQQSALMTQYASYCNLAPGKFFLHGIASGEYVNDGTSLYYTTHGPAALSWSTPGLQTVFQNARDLGCFIGSSWTDEYPWLGKPMQPIPQLGVNVGTITCNGAGSCTASWPTGSMTSTGVIIYGANQSAFNSTPGTHFVASLSSGTLTFTCAACAGLTATAASDPNLILNPIDGAWYASNTDFNHWDAFRFIRQMRANVPNAPAMTWPLQGGASGSSIYNIEGDPSFSDYADIYFDTQNNAFGFNALHKSVYTFTGDIGNRIRSYLASVPNGSPLIIETTLLALNYGFQGTTCPISSITDETITFSSPCPISQLYPGISRLAVTGTDNAAYNVNFYINDVLDSTHVTVSLATSTIDTNNAPNDNGGYLFESGGNCCSGSAQFADGTTIALHAVKVSPGNIIWDKSGKPCTGMDNHRGQDFTITGSSYSALNSASFWWPRETPSCSTNVQFHFRQNPTGTANGGTATVFADDYYYPGRNASANAMAPVAPPQFFFENFYSLSPGTVGLRAYPISEEAQLFSPTLGLWGTPNISFSDSSPGTRQAGVHPKWDQGYNGTLLFAGTANANLFFQNRLAKYILGGTRLNTPDNCGANFEAFAFSSSYGKVLIVLPMHNGLSETCTMTLTPFKTSGQQIIKYTIAWNGLTVATLPASTVTDTVVYPYATPVVYVFPVDYSSDAPQQPVLAARLADIPNATKIAVRWAYNPALVDAGTAMTADCGAGVCTLPVDRNISTIYYRIIYLRSDSSVAATSDIQTL